VLPPKEKGSLGIHKKLPVLQVAVTACMVTPTINLKPNTHQAHFTPDFAPGVAQNLPTRRTFAGFSHLVLSVDSATIL